MAKARKGDESDSPKKIRRAISPEAREQQIISLAIDEAERQILNHTASSQVLTHFLKLATEKARLERAKLESEIELLEAKGEAYKSQAHMDELYTEVLHAFKEYRGEEEDGDEYGDVEELY